MMMTIHAVEEPVTYMERNSGFARYTMHGPNTCVKYVASVSVKIVVLRIISISILQGSIYMYLL